MQTSTRSITFVAALFQEAHTHTCICSGTKTIHVLTNKPDVFVSRLSFIRNYSQSPFGYNSAAYLYA